MSLIDHYNAAVVQGDINSDPVQRSIIVELQRMVDDLKSPRDPWYQGWRKKKIQGLYLHGTVGVGKTFLVDLFYQHLPDAHKARFHFHHFMQQIDAQLRARQGKKDPLRAIAADIAKSTRILCLDEFLVHDVADAMILAELLQALYTFDIVLVIAANTSPDDLYLNGPQRARFLPAIELLKQHCHVLLLKNNHDYRVGHTPLFQAYLTPLNEAAQHALEVQFNALVTRPCEHGDLIIQNRPVQCVKYSGSVVWFSFDTICNVPRCQLDYLEIADRFNTVFVSGIPSLGPDDTPRVILLIHFIDVMYDRGIRLIVSAAVPLAKLYIEGPMSQSFKRTLSRLDEMQSVDYLQRHAYRNVSNFSQQ